MRQSQLPNFVRKEFPKDEESYNAKILVRAGFIDKLMAGAYSYLPLGLRVLEKIENIVKEEMNALGAFEIRMPVLSPKENWEKTGRWKSFDALFKVIARDKKEYALGPTHEEIIIPLSQRAVFSYKDLPFSLYQIQTKFRDEARVKSGLLRGKEFLMKDLYSFHADAKDLDHFYEKVSRAYFGIFKKLGLDAWRVEASGGTFSKYSHEFQVFIEDGEDEVVCCPHCRFARNKEMFSSKQTGNCPVCKSSLEVAQASEVGNVFKLGTNYSGPFSLKYRDKNGQEKNVVMGCYGIGISRLMGVLAEVFHDKDGLLWPSSLAPFQAHLLSVFGSDAAVNKKIGKQAEEAYKKLAAAGVEVLFDDRKNKTAGEKLVESDLIGIPVRLVVSQKTGDKIEFKERSKEKTQLVDFSFIKNYLDR
ncbi:MAG: Prolyl-tRNA synthetase [Candidatus Wolfebacteria bacterium GW2011_GWC1_43_10]|uniref:Proline--tRNA ligase n=2 Tax=Candidatus Wolfeibacteriota TaxID=1752735 RepID=A0A0G1CCJ0_9BACT|nr:MAG: Prolyl-tRNA synthetase [Candidatus Wolfebacteria bacterium GW2011_GWC1_43_10]KKT22725.1 MAG: Prolyl-tRNA synthetase [Parcubacteria group bacterium GW2011_GWB1_43_8b]OGM90059.1 MAG: hypothetical protein A2108_01840 [Candidatus Wolfebacteria bacterium GWA1_42_9]